ncbi:hypothetical protein CFR78_10960 [Komagataeibacter rhaeticus]|uniref:hypothetical protein n=1 Tax=Komagataeibacter rhaeticus TaxID=215221 RepID=UPI000551E187|nr:hypothetical protein [Komagataeibacter rhaeticus]MBL7239657.1 hypothetical protein [Komagataeibacter rhaeticus]PYD53114.1 hypothetical protein CFR78_10960 [Komagataeibacter rhaeticus]GBQ13061.1 hypothetical protein AA16663_1363 [Komagataeibacter rhaeticus DSM 16663]
MTSPHAPSWFTAPDSRFRTAAFWFWHFLPTEEQCLQTIRDMKAAGLGCVLVQARLPLPLETYLSDAYLARCRFVARQVHKAGMRLEIYDEYGWMSGHGGGRTIAGADHLRERHLFWVSGTIRKGQATLELTGIHSTFLSFLGTAGRNWCYEGGQPLWGDWSVIGGGTWHAGRPACTVPATQVTIGETRPDGCVLHVHAPTLADGTDITILVAGRCKTSRLINYLLPQAGQHFIKQAYEPLLDAFPTAEAFFFDHPYAGFYQWDGQSGTIGNSILWDESLLDANFTLTGFLTCLYGEGAEAGRLRGAFFNRYIRKMHEAFFGVLRKWCDTHAIGLTGHELLPHVGGWALRGGLNGFDPRVMPGNDPFGIDAYKTRTVMDAADYRPQLSAILGDSVARSHGRSRCTVEQYSTGREVGRPSLQGQWDLTLDRLRAQMLRHTLQGARRVLLHAVFQPEILALASDACPDPRFDFPPGFNLQPWWRMAPGVMDEVARLSAFLEEGTPVRSVALLYPLESLLEGTDGTTPACALHFGAWAEALFDNGTGYTIIDENQIHTDNIENGLLNARSGTFSCIIIPAITTFRNTETLRALDVFARSGGRLFFSHDRKPDAIPSGGMEKTLCGTGHVSGIDEIGHHVKKHFQKDIFHIENMPQRLALQEMDEATRRIAAFNDSGQMQHAVLHPAPYHRKITQWFCESGKTRTLAHLPAGCALRMILRPLALTTLETRRVPPAAAWLAPDSHPVPAPGARPVILGSGWSFQAGEKAQPHPIHVDRGWEAQGYPAFSGEGLYTLCTTLPAHRDDQTWYLVLPEVGGAAECFVNGQPCGGSIGQEAAFPLTDHAGAISIHLSLYNTLFNSLYANRPDRDPRGSTRSGILAPPRLELREKTACLRIVPPAAL